MMNNLQSTTDNPPPTTHHKQPTTHTLLGYSKRDLLNLRLVRGLVDGDQVTVSRIDARVKDHLDFVRRRAVEKELLTLGDQGLAEVVGVGHLIHAGDTDDVAIHVLH